MVVHDRLLGLPNGYALLLSGVQPVQERATPRNSSACRPRSYIPSDRRNLHAIHHAHASRAMESLDDGFDLGVSVSGRTFRAGASSLAGAGGSPIIPCTRLGDCRRMEAASRRHQFGNGFPDLQWRNPLHDRRNVSFLAWVAVPECDLACICRGRRRLPLRRGSADRTGRLASNELGALQNSFKH